MVKNVEIIGLETLEMALDVIVETTNKSVYVRDSGKAAAAQANALFNRGLVEYDDFDTRLLMPTQKLRKAFGSNGEARFNNLWVSVKQVPHWAISNGYRVRFEVDDEGVWTPQGK